MASQVQWWCSAHSGLPWTWRWRPYPGIWMVAATVAAVYWRVSRRGPRTPDARRRRIIGWIGVVLVWASLDWPLGPLAAGYLATAHAAQFLLLTMIDAPLILIGLEPGLAARGERAGFAGRALHFLTIPLTAGVLFTAISAATHVPGVVDSAMVSPLGCFGLDITWLLSGILLWWPVILSVPKHDFNVLWKILYLFLATMVHSGIAAVMLFATFPFYSVYQLAPPLHPFTPLADLQVAGGVMELGGTFITFGVMTALFFMWVKRTNAEAEG